MGVIWTSPDAADVLLLIGSVVAGVATIYSAVYRQFAMALLCAAVTFIAVGLLAF